MKYRLKYIGLANDNKLLRLLCRSLHEYSIPDEMLASVDGRTCDACPSHHLRTSDGMRIGPTNIRIALAAAAAVETEAVGFSSCEAPLDGCEDLQLPAERSQFSENSRFTCSCAYTKGYVCFDEGRQLVRKRATNAKLISMKTRCIGRVMLCSSTHFFQAKKSTNRSRY